MGKNKKKKKVAKRLPKVTKRLPRKKKSPFKIVVRNWDVEPFDPDYQKEILLNVDSSMEISIDGYVYNISIDKKNRCLQFSTRENHLFLQPISVRTFLVKANSKTKDNENNKIE